MSKNFNDHVFLYPETDEELAIREEQELTNKEPAGVHAYHGKARNLFTSKYKASKITRTRKVTVSMESKAWKDYIAGHISFSEMKKQLKLFR